MTKKIFQLDWILVRSKLGLTNDLLIDKNYLQACYGALFGGPLGRWSFTITVIEISRGPHPREKGF